MNLAPIQFELNQGLAIIRLNRPEALNALSLEMFQLMQEQLLLWKDDPSVAVIALLGTGPKAFCAGGDIKEVYRACVREDHKWTSEFFRREYQVDGMIHRYPKPIVAFGHGLVLGGGWGLFAGATVKVATPDTQFGMPEIFIGFVPDVGSSFFLSNLECNIGRFMALTASRVGAFDALELGLIDAVLHSSSTEMLMRRLKTQVWRHEPQSDRDTLTRLLKELETCTRPKDSTSILQNHKELLNEFAGLQSLPEVTAFLRTLQTDADPWLRLAGQNFAYGSPTSIALAFEEFRRAKILSLEDCLKMEFHLALQCCVRHEFREGVKARLIDKLPQPNWKPARLEETSPQEITAHFEPTSWDFVLQ